jgi:hypothetical protein
MTTEIPTEFTKVIKDFVSDMQTTFPEFQPLIRKWWKSEEDFSHLEEKEAAMKEAETKSIAFLYKFCKKKYPPRFFDILYQNEKMFSDEEEAIDYDTEFLPLIRFKDIWHFEISEQTRKTIWKYLQLITFSIVGSMDNKEQFGEAARLFEMINEDEFKTKLEQTMEQMTGMFMEEEAQKEMPSAEDIHSKINEMMGGKLGALAQEIAEETAASLDIDMENTKNMKDVFSGLIKNPTKLMGLLKTVGSKLENKIKSGEIKESELMEEATEMMNKMKNMPGMEHMQSMLSKLGGGGKVNLGAMKNKLDSNLRMAKMKERMREKCDKKQTQASAPVQAQAQAQAQAQVFSTGETVEKTPRGAKPNPVINVSEKKKKKNKK